MDKRVACDCDGLRASGDFETDGAWLILRSTLGEHRVRLGIANPRKLAARLLKNLCAKASGAAPPNAMDPSGGSPSVADKAQEMIDAQRDKIVAMASGDPQRAGEERVLDQMIANARAIDTAVQSLAPVDAGLALTVRAPNTDCLDQ